MPSAAASSACFARSAMNRRARHAVEAVALLDDEGAVERERQIDEREQHHRRRDERDAVPQAARFRDASPLHMQPVDDAAEREREQHGGAHQHLEHAEAGLRHRVVRGLLVRAERNRLGERLRHRAAMRAYVAHLAPRQPEARRARRRERAEEEPGQCVEHAVRE